MVASRGLFDHLPDPPEHNARTRQARAEADRGTLRHDPAGGELAGRVLAEACADKAEAGGWDRDGATLWILGYLAEHGPTSGEVLVTLAGEHYRPHDGRAFGAIFGRLSRRGIIRKAGYVNRVQKGHGAPGAVVWELTEAAEGEST